jgi:hypothetical protein
MLLELMEGLVDREQFDILHWGSDFDARNVNAPLATAMTPSLLASRPVNQDPPHGLGRGGKEMCAIHSAIKKRNGLGGAA